MTSLMASIETGESIHEFRRVGNTQMSLWEGARGRWSKEPLLLLFQASGLAVRAAGCLHILTPCHCQRRWVRWTIEKRARWKRKSKSQIHKDTGCWQTIESSLPGIDFWNNERESSSTFLGGRMQKCHSHFPSWLVTCWGIFVVLHKFQGGFCLCTESFLRRSSLCFSWRGKVSTLEWISSLSHLI